MAAVALLDEELLDDDELLDEVLELELRLELELDTLELELEAMLELELDMTLELDELELEALLELGLLVALELLLALELELTTDEALLALFEPGDEVTLLELELLPLSLPTPLQALSDANKMATMSLGKYFIFQSMIKKTDGARLQLSDQLPKNFAAAAQRIQHCPHPTTGAVTAYSEWVRFLSVSLTVRSTTATSRNMTFHSSGKMARHNSLLFACVATATT